METKDLLKKVRKIEIKTRKLSSNIFGGEYHSAFKGRGMTFSEVRNYQFGDDVRTIDWNVTARYNEPFVKIFEEERELTLMLMVDVSNSALFGTNNALKKNIITEISETLAFSALKNNDNIKITFLPAVHWSKRSLTDTNKTLWGNFLIQYKDIKILFACDTGYGNIYKEIGKKYGPIDITMINIGAYDFRPMFDKSIYHTTPEEALNVAQDLRSKKVLGMHWGTFVLSLEPIMEPPIRFKENAEKFGFKKKDTITFKIGEINSLNSILKD